LAGTGFLAIQRSFSWRTSTEQHNITLILFTTAPMEMNHYEVLEISRDAELIDIKKAYRRLALK
jgi:DnaJ-class molecular chaperone